MELRITVPFGLALFLCGCASYDGVYSPSCEMYAGSEIQLEHGRFTWTKFTDEVVIDKEGAEVDQFPGFPMRGEYTRKGAQVTLIPAEGKPPETMFVSRENSDLYLYTADEFEMFEMTGERPACALKLLGSRAKS